MKENENKHVECSCHYCKARDKQPATKNKLEIAKCYNCSQPYLYNKDGVTYSC